MRKPCSALLFFVLLVLGLSLIGPVEDLPETPYDESEALPYESTPGISEVLPQGSASTTQAVRSRMPCQLDTPFPVSARRSSGADSIRLAEAPVTLELLSTLLC